jgi:uncharacterized protein (TIGR02145 family)
VLYDVNNPIPNSVFANQSFQTFVNINDELGNLLYREEHFASTDGNGLITVKMGDGSYVAGPITNFNQINWATGKYYLVVDFNINGTISSTAPEQLVTVPYSFYSGKAGNGMSSVIDNGNGTLTFTYVNGTSYTTAPLTGLQGSSGSFPPGTNVGDMYFWNGTTWQIVPIGTQGQFLTVSNGIPSWQSTTPSLNLPIVSGLNCSNVIVSGSFYQSSSLVGMTLTLPYTGGNGVGYNAQTIQSLGVTGLTATLVSGVLQNGAGTLTYNLTGIANASGTASFPVVFGGQNCVISINVQSTVNNPYLPGSIFCASGPTAIVDVTNPTTGKTWMDRNLGAMQAATNPNDATANGDLYQWGRGNDGHQCRTSTTTTVLSALDQPGNDSFILTSMQPYDWRSPQNDNLWQGVNGVNNPCPNGYRVPSISELNAEIASWSESNPVGAFASPLKFTVAGSRDQTGVDSYSYPGVGYYWSSSPTGIGALNIMLDFPTDIINNGRSIGFSVRCIKDASASPTTLGTLNCGSTSITGTLTIGTAASGVSASVPYTGGNGGSYAAQTISSTGVTGLTATLSSGILANGSGSLSFAISGTPATSGTASFALTIGGQSCTFTVLAAPPAAALSALNCTSGATTGSLTINTPASGVTKTIPYTGGNGGTYSTQAVPSTGVLGLTANLSGGTLAVGAGNLVYTITGTPASSGTANFAITIGGQSCTFSITVAYSLPALYPMGSVFCASGPTVIVDVTNPATGKTWMDRNLGASQVATSSTNSAAYGDLYQWGRRADGHQCRTSATTLTLSSTDQPANGNFIKGLIPNPYDWRSPQNTNLWQGVNGVNNPCPSAYRIPTDAELNAESLSWSVMTSAGAFASTLKLPMAGLRYYSDGSLLDVGTYGYYWSSTVSGTKSNVLRFYNLIASITDNLRASGCTVRCIKN